MSALSLDTFLTAEESERIENYIVRRFGKVSNKKAMIKIFVSKELDIFTFNRLNAIAAGFNVELKRAQTPQSGLFRDCEPPQSLGQLKALHIIDELYTVQKSIERLKVISQF